MLSSGLIIYHGPRELVLPFFEGLGFACPERKGVAEFLQEVPTLADQRRYWARDPRTYKGRPRRVLINHLGQQLPGRPLLHRHHLVSSQRRGRGAAYAQRSLPVRTGVCNIIPTCAPSPPYPRSMVDSFPDSAMLVEALPVWYKQRAARF